MVSPNPRMLIRWLTECVPPTSTPGISRSKSDM
ncbi:Uncharacterised protein [Vibrio cholerae]|nr:Uncharacterised protein [Vibrio cholerae]